MVKQKPKNVEELRDRLLDTFNGLETGSVRVADAKERSNCAGKIINSVKIQLDYAALRKEKPEIDFMKV